MTCFKKKNSFNSNENDILNESTGLAKELKQKENDSNYYKNINENNAIVDIINVNDENKSEKNNLKFYHKSFINNFLNDDSDKKTSFSNIKWDENSLRNFDSNNELLNFLKSEKNLNLNTKSKLNFKKQNSISTFNCNLEENKNKNSAYLFKNEDKEIFLFNKSSGFTPTRNNSDLHELLMFSDENYNSNNYFNSKNNGIIKLEKSKDTNANYNSLRSHSFEKMVYKKFKANKENKNKTLNTNNNNNNIKNKSSKKNFVNKSNQGSNPNLKINNKNKAGEQTENPIDKYFQKRHLREMQKLDSLRQERLNKEVSEIKEKPSISDASKKICAEKIQKNVSEQTVFDRLLAPAQVFLKILN